MKTNPFDWINSITYTKDNLLESNNPKDYNSFIVNKGLSYHLDCLLLVNEMNIRNNLDKDMQYMFYMNSVRKRKRYSCWEKKNMDEDLKYIKRYYNCSNEKALQALKVLTKEQIEYIHNKLETFGPEFV